MFFGYFCVCLITPFVKVNNFHFIHMIFLISLQCLFMSLFLFFVKVFVHLLFAGFNLFSFLQYDFTCLGDRNSLQLFFGFSNVFAKQIVCCLLLDRTSDFGVFKDFTLKTLHTLSAFGMKLSLSSFPLVNSQSVLRNFFMFISDNFY